MNSTRDITAEIKPHVNQIKVAAEAGNTNAQNVIKWYGMWCRCPGDSAAFVVVCEYFDAWRKDYLNNKLHKRLNDET